MCEIWGTRTCRNFSPEPMGVQLGTPWLRDEGAVGQASASQAHLPGCLMPNLNKPPQKHRACSLPSYPSLFRDENDPPCNTAQPRLWKAHHSQPLGSQRQNVGVGCLSYSFGQSYYHHIAEKLSGVSVMVTPNPQISRYTRTRDSVQPGTRHIPSNISPCQMHKVSPSGDLPAGGPQPGFANKGTGLVLHGNWCWNQ